MKKTLLIFDIDGTLIQTRAGRIAFNRAFERAFGLKEAARTVLMAGRTDPAIHREVCEAYHLDPASFGAWKQEFLSELADALTHDPGVVLPGVLELLQRCAPDPSFMLALGTGNVEEGARLKLAVHNLNRFFTAGGFGADGENRDEVIARGIQRAEALHGSPFERMVVIGDTPLDIRCGKANRCLTVGVATGPHRRDELEVCGADLVMDSLADAEGFLRRLRAMVA